MSDALLPLIAFEESVYAPPGDPLVARNPDVYRAIDVLKGRGYATHEWSPATGHHGGNLAIELTFPSRHPNQEIAAYFIFGDDFTEFNLSFPRKATPVWRASRYGFQVHLDREDTDFDRFIAKVTSPTFFGFLFGQSLNKTERYTISRIAKTEPSYAKLRDAFNAVVKIIEGVPPEEEEMHTISGWDESRLNEAAREWAVTPESLAALSAAALARGFTIEGTVERHFLQCKKSITLPHRASSVTLELEVFLNEAGLFSLNQLRSIIVGIEQYDRKPKDFLYDFYASISPHQKLWIISPLDSRAGIPDDPTHPDFEKLLTTAPKYLDAIQSSAYFSIDKAKAWRELKQIRRCAKHLAPYAPVLKEMFDLLVDGPPPPPEEEMHEITGWDEAVVKEEKEWAFPEENQKQAKRWAEGEFPGEFKAKTGTLSMPRRPTSHLWYEFVFDWARPRIITARAILYFARTEVDLILSNSNAGCSYEEAPDGFEDYLRTINSTIVVETGVPPAIREKLKRAYEGFLARLRPPPEPEEMHTITGWDEARTTVNWPVLSKAFKDVERRSRYPTTDFSELTGVDWRTLGMRAAAVDSRVVFHDGSGRITYNRAEGDPSFNISLTPLPVNAPQIAEIRVESELDEPFPAQYVHDETIVLPDRFPLTYEGVTGNEWLTAGGAALWPDIVRLFMSARTPEPEEMHTISGWDEGRGIAGVIDHDEHLLAESYGRIGTRHTYSSREGALAAEPRDFEATLDWAKATLTSPTVNVFGYVFGPAGARECSLVLKIPSTIFEGAWIAMHWHNWTDFCRFELEIPRGRSTAYVSFDPWIMANFNFVVYPEYATFDAALTKMQEGLVRPVLINALKKFRKKETNLGKLTQLYNEIHRRLFAPPPPEEEMHEITGWDESREGEWKPMGFEAFEALELGTNVTVWDGDKGTVRGATFLGRMPKKTAMGWVLFAKVRYHEPIQRYGGEVTEDTVRSGNVGYTDVPEEETMHELTGWDEARAVETVNFREVDMPRLKAALESQNYWDRVTIAELGETKGAWYGWIVKEWKDNRLPEQHAGSWHELTIELRFDPRYGPEGMTVKTLAPPRTASHLAAMRRLRYPLEAVPTAISGAKLKPRNAAPNPQFSADFFEAYATFIRAVDVPPEPEEMHEITGWDESVLKEAAVKWTPFDNDLRSEVAFKFERNLTDEWTVTIPRSAFSFIPYVTSGLRGSRVPELGDTFPLYLKKYKLVYKIPPGEAPTEENMRLVVGFVFRYAKSSYSVVTVGGKMAHAFKNDWKFLPLFQAREAHRPDGHNFLYFHNESSKNYYVRAFWEGINKAVRAEIVGLLDKAHEQFAGDIEREIAQQAPAIKALYTPPEPEEMHEITGWDEARGAGTVNLSHLTRADLEEIEPRLKSLSYFGHVIHSPLHYAEFLEVTKDWNIHRITLELYIGSIATFVVKTRVFANLPGKGREWLNRQVSFPITAVPKAWSEKKMLSKRLQGITTYELGLANERFAEAYAKFIGNLAPVVEPEEMHEISGWDESLSTIIGSDEALLKR